jgi:hypothetical protein
MSDACCDLDAHDTPVFNSWLSGDIRDFCLQIVPAYGKPVAKRGAIGYHPGLNECSKQK